MIVLSIVSGIYFYVNNKSFFFHWHLFFYFISNNNCRLLTINIVSFIFFYYPESKPPFCLYYEKSSPVNIVYRKINWQNPASISAYTQSEYRISNYVNHIRIIVKDVYARSRANISFYICYYTTPFLQIHPQIIRHTGAAIMTSI